MFIIISWPVAFFCGGIWILLQPFEALFQFVKQITSFLEKLITWPRDLGKAIVNCQESFPSPM